MFLLLFRQVESLGDSCFVNGKGGQVLAALLEQEAAVLEGDGRRIERDALCLDAFDDFRITGDNGAIVAVLFLAFFLEQHERHEDAVHLLLEKVLDVAVYQFCRETDVVRHDHAGSLFIVLEIGRSRQFYLYVAGGKECMPEGIFLVHVQGTGDADGQAWHGQVGMTLEQQFIFDGIDVFPFLLVFVSVGEYFFTAVAGVVIFPVAKPVTGDVAMILTALASQVCRCILCLAKHVVQQQVASGMPQGVKGTTEGAHQFRAVAPGDFTAGQKFNGTHHGIVAHGAALDHNVLAQNGSVFQFEHFVQAVFDHGIGEPCGNVVDCGAFPQHLLDFGVHEYRAAGAQITGCLGMACRLGKFMDTVSQRLGEGFHERPAAGGAGFIDFNPVNDLPVDENGFHVLPANVQDERDVLVQLAGCEVVGNGLNDAALQLESCLDEVLAVAGGTAAFDAERGAVVFAFFLQLEQTRFDGADRIPVVVAVIGV